jgi:hypothetical protein
VTKEPEFLVNRWKCKDGTILQSKHRHDYVSHTDANGEFYFVDGGLEYIRHSGNMEPICLYSNDPHELIREAFYWGTRKSGALVWVHPSEMQTEHIWAIIETQTQISSEVKELFKNELEYRQHLTIQN